MRKIFICGGAGFIGGHLVERLLATPGVEAVTIFDNLSSGKRSSIQIDDRVEFVIAHAQDPSALTSAMSRAQPDTVFHLAANPDIARAVTEPTIDFDQGTVLTQNVLEAMRLNGVKRLIYTSGSGVYGERDETFFESSGGMEPISTYGASKLASEAMISAYTHMFGMTARVFRFANVVGPRQTHGVGYDFLRKLKQDRKRLTILGDGHQTKSYVHVADILNAVMMIVGLIDDILTDAERPYNVFNVGTQDTLTVTQIAEMAVLASGIAPGFCEFDYSGGSRGWRGDVPKVRMNYGKIQSFGWRPTLTSKDAMWLSLIAMAEELK